MVKGEYFALSFIAKDLAILTEFPQLVIIILMHLFLTFAFKKMVKGLVLCLPLYS